MAQERIMVVEDEEGIAELIAYNLTREGYDVDSKGTAEEAREVLLKCPREGELPDLLLLDLMLPGMDGFELCKVLKADAVTRDIPIVMLTARGEEPDVVAGLELGAEDYIVKPFSPRVLIARVKSVLRRRGGAQVASDGVISVGDLSIHVGKHEVRLANTVVDLTSTEFRILLCLSEKPGWVFTRSQIVDKVQGFDFAVTDRTIDVHIAALRKKLGDYAEVIQTVRGVGYKMRESSDP